MARHATARRPKRVDPFKIVGHLDVDRVAPRLHHLDEREVALTKASLMSHIGAAQAPKGHAYSLTKVAAARLPMAPVGTTTSRDVQENNLAPQHNHICTWRERRMMLYEFAPVKPCWALKVVETRLMGRPGRRHLAEVTDPNSSTTRTFSSPLKSEI